MQQVTLNLSEARCIVVLPHFVSLLTAGPTAWITPKAGVIHFDTHSYVDVFMEKKLPLFREEAIAHRLNRSLGTIRINVPLNYKILSYVSTGLLLVLMLFLLFAKVSEKIVVKGYLDADKGIITIRSNLDGTIFKSQVEEGKRVRKGESLLVISREDHKKTTELIENLDQRIKNLKQQHQLKQEHYNSLKTLFKKHYVSAVMMKNTKSDLLELTNKIKLIDLELIHYKQSLNQIIRAPVNGIATNILYRSNQSVAQASNLLQIIPEKSKLVARLYIPAQDIGFIKKGKTISLIYDAYPAKRFGTYKALIKEINLTILTDDKEDKPIKIGQPYYKIKAELEHSQLNIHGKKTHLNYGMTFKAIVRGEKKKLWQWILEPAYSFYGELSHV